MQSKLQKWTGGFISFFLFFFSSIIYIQTVFIMNCTNWCSLNGNAFHWATRFFNGWSILPLDLAKHVGITVLIIFLNPFKCIVIDLNPAPSDLLHSNFQSAQSWNWIKSSVQKVVILNSNHLILLVYPILFAAHVFQICWSRFTRIIWNGVSFILSYIKNGLSYYRSWCRMERCQYQLH